MLWIGVTGPMGSGKSTVSELLRRLGYTVLDADEVVSQLLAPGQEAEQEVLKAFGPSVSDTQGHLDRRALGRMVFGDVSLLERLEKILHPRVRDSVAQQKARLIKNGAVAAFYDVPLLFEKKMEDQFDLILVVQSSPALRLSRLQQRTGLSRAEIEERWSRQLPPEYKEARASAVIRNEADLKALEDEVRACLKRLQIPLPASA